jgi:hypothetical protein
MSDSAKIRIPWSLAKKIDGLRGGVPRERYVRDVLEAHVEQATSGPVTHPSERVSEGSTPSSPRSSSARPALRADKPFRPAPKGK